MTEPELRALVREAVARHLHHGGPSCGSEHVSRAAIAASVPELQPDPHSRLEPAAHTHVSHARYIALVNAGGACLIEPAVACNHCGFCQTHGH